MKWLALFIALAALGACASSSKESWIGRNVGVCVDSFEEESAQQADRR